MTIFKDPFAEQSTLPYKLTPFDQIADSDYLTSIEAAMKEHQTEIASIASNEAEATFDNTVVALESSGSRLQRVLSAFGNKVSADTNDTLKEIHTKIAPKMAAHQDSIVLNENLFARIAALYDSRDDIKLAPQANYLLERYYRDFVRSGARLNDTDKNRLRDINEELSSLSTAFSQKQLTATNDAAVLIDDVNELDGLPANVIASAAAAAESRGETGKYLLTFSNFTNQPHLASLKDASVRRRVYEASIIRGANGGDSDTSADLLKIVTLRAERAALLGYENHAAYVIADQTAKTVQAAATMLTSLVPAALANFAKEASERATVLGQETIHPADWSIATEQLRAERYQFDSAQMRPYFELERVLHDGVFFAANQLYGITFTELHGLPTYHPEVRTFEVHNADGSSLGMFCADYFTRDSKGGGAWMNALVPQSHLLNNQPVVTNNMNIPKPRDGEPALMTINEVSTMFHEFGHALHGLFSDVTYPRFSGTSVPRDYVEFPSQVNEMWMTWPEVINNYAKHYETGEPMPQEMVDKLIESRRFNEGFATTEYLAAAILDLAWHRLSSDKIPDGTDPSRQVAAFEDAALREAGFDPDSIQPRYRSTYFGHIFGGGYAAGYYSYIWSEVLAKHSEQWFTDNGGLSRDNGDRFRSTLLSRGGSIDPMQQFRDFTGSDPDILPLLKARGLDTKN